jgi:hypothetical protein
VGAEDIAQLLGGNSDTLNVDIFDGTRHNGIWSFSGQQQTSGGQAYTQAVDDFVDLPAIGSVMLIELMEKFNENQVLCFMSTWTISECNPVSDYFVSFSWCCPGGRCLVAG